MSLSTPSVGWDLDVAGSLAVVLSALDRSTDGSRAEALLVVANQAGLDNARHVRRLIRAVGGPTALVLAPRASVCAMPEAMPCAYSSTITNNDGFSSLMVLRQYWAAAFFRAGAAPKKKIEKKIVVQSSVLNRKPWLKYELNGRRHRLQPESHTTWSITSIIATSIATITT